MQVVEQLPTKSNILCLRGSRWLKRVSGAGDCDDLPKGSDEMRGVAENRNRTSDMNVFELPDLHYLLHILRKSIERPKRASFLKVLYADLDP